MQMQRQVHAATQEMEKFSCPYICTPEHMNRDITNANTNARFHAVMVQWEETWTVPAYLELPCVTDGCVNIISFSICSCMCLKVLASNCFQISTLESDYTFLPSIVTGGIVAL